MTPIRHAAFSGIYPMQYAFFAKDGSLDRHAMARQVEGCIAAGADGIAVLGLGTEVNKLSLVERTDVLEWTMDAVSGRVPVSVTVAEPSVAGQIEFARRAADLGAAWIVLQPPPVRAAREDELIRFFGKVADAVPLPIGIQNAPEYIGIGLTPQGVGTLVRNHGNFRVLKGEGPVLSVKPYIDAADGLVDVFNGRAGLELIDNLLAGCAGIVPGAETVDFQKRIFDLVSTGDAADLQKAHELYRSLLPLVVFLMQSLDNLLCYGKRLAALRYGIGQVYLRDPASEPTEFGLRCLEGAARHLYPDLDYSRLGSGNGPARKSNEE